MSRWFLVLTVILIIGLIILPNNHSYFPNLNFLSSPSAQTQQSRSYTTNADFAEGQLFGLEYTTTANQLQISAESSTFPFIWVPNSNNATISKIDTSTGKELGRYRTSGNSGANPSRTTVDLQGNCWVGNRQIGSAVKVGLLESGQCVDRNGNGQIDTSRDTNQNGDIDATEVLDWGQDECVLTEVILVPGSEGAHLPGTYTGQYANDYWNPGPRGIAIDSQGNAWIGTYGTKKYYYVNGSSGQIIKSVDVSSVNHTPYGAVIDRNGILWSSGYDASPSNAEILRLNTATNAFTTINLGHQVYGIALDNLNHLFVSAWTDRKLSRINILTGQVEWTRDGNADDAGSRGVAVTADGDVWVANSDSGKVSRWSNDGVKKTAIAVGNQPTGVAVDSAGKVWAVNYGDEFVKRINPTSNAIDLEKRVIGCYHYGYSDMTGIVARTVTTKTGTWTVIYDSTVANAQWGVLNWNGLEPAGTSISVRVRSSSNQATWSTWEQAGKGITLSATPAGRYLQIEVTLQISSGTVSPALYDLTVSTGSGQTQTCTYGVSPSTLNFSSAANSGSITITAPTGCAWSTVTTASWITITSGNSGSGNGTVSFQIQANTGTSPRTRSIVVAGKPVLITQSGTSSTCTITPYPINQSALGTLSTTDCRSIVDPNAYADFYTFSGQAGKLISIELYSLAFDAYLTLFDPNGNIIAWNDDGNAGSTNSRIPHGTGYFVLPFTGTYLIEASSYNANETGGYTLTLMEAPGTTNCTYTVTPSTATFGPVGGLNSITVQAPAGCSWNALPLSNWISFTSASTGSGNGFVNYEIQPNTSQGFRVGKIYAAGQFISIIQAGTGGDCPVTPLTIPTSVNGSWAIGDCASGGGGFSDLYSFQAPAGQQVQIILTTQNTFTGLYLTMPAAGLTYTSEGDGTRRIPSTGYLVLPDTGTYLVEVNAAATGNYTLTINVPQTTPTCTYQLSPTSQTLPSSGGAGTISVTTQLGCNWSVTNSNSWVTITGGSSGSGNGTVSYTVAANPAAARSGVLTIGGQTFTVNQAGASTAFILVDHMTTGGPISSEGCQAPVPRSNFSTGDARVYHWIYFLNPKVGDTIRWVFIQPNGSTYFTYNSSVQYSDYDCQWAWIDIAGFEAASLPGQWRVDLYYNNSLLISDRFNLFSLNTCPTITGISPAIGAVGSSVTITGTNFTGVTSVRFSPDVTAVFTVNSSSQITATVPAGAATGPIRLVKSGCQDERTTTFTVSGSPPTDCIQPPSGLIAWWPGDEWIDDIIGGRTGILGFALSILPGKVSNSFRFDGVDDFFRVNTTGIIKGLSEMTIDAWVRPLGPHSNGYAYGGTVFHESVAGSSETTRLSFYVLNDGRVNIFTRTDDQTVRMVTTTATIPLNQWSFIAATYSATSGLKIYINGQEAGSLQGSFGSFINSNSAFVAVGSDSLNAVGDEFNGDIDELEIFNRALTQAELLAIYQADSAGKCKTAPPTDCVQPPSGMIAWLPGDGTTTDLTGNHNGTLQNGATYAAGKVGQAFSFDGVDDFVDLGAWNAGATWTLEAWVNPAALPTGRKGILGGYQSCADWGISLEDGKFGVTVNEPTACTRTYLWDQTPTTGAWYHVVGTNDGATARLYVNGVLRISGPVTANYIGTGAGTRIGGEVCCTGDFFPGLIDEPTIYNRALSAAEILAIYNAGSNGKCKTAQPGCPTVTGINPTSGATGTTVTISGTNFTGVTGVTFSGNQAAQFVVVNSTTITAVVPAGAQTGAITLTKPNCTNVTTGSFTVTTSPCIGVSISSQLTGQSGGTLTVPILATDTSGKGAISYDLILNFNPNVIQPQSPVYDKAGTLSSGLTITTNTGTPGELRLSAFGSIPLTETGTLLNLKFNIVGAADSCTALTFTSFRFNEGTPCSTTTNGQVCVTGGSVAGNVTYCISAGPVPGVAINAAGSPPVNTTTDAMGNYSLTGLGGGAYTVTPSKTGGANGIASYDAALIAQNVVNLITFTDCQRLAGDTSGDGSLSSYDSALIAQYVVGISNPDSKVGSWKFTPANRAYASVSGQQTGQNFSAVLIGDVSGNWSPAAMVSGNGINLIRQDQAVAVALPVTGGVTGATVTLPITVGDLTGRGVIAWDLDITFDPAVLTPADPPVDATGTLSSSMTITPNATPGRLRISAFGTEALTGTGTLIKLRFNIAGSTGNGSDLTWQMFQFNEGSPAAATTTGRVTVVDALTISLTPAEQTIGLGTSGTIAATISSQMPFDIGVALATSNPAIAGVPAMVVIPAGQTMADISVNGAGAGGPVDVTATLPAALGGASATAKVTVIRVVTGVSAASYLRDELASESIIASFGTEMATDTQVATSIPLPTSLAGTQVEVKDSGGTARLSSLFFVSPTQINFQIPAGTLTGPAELKVTGGDGKISLGSMLIATIAPGLFSANASGQGVAAAVALRVKPTGEQIYEACAEWSPASQQFVAKSIDMSQTGDQVYLILYGTGLRFRSDLAAAKLFFGDIMTGVLYAGAQGDFVGLDQINVLIPPELTARGDIVIKLEVDGKTSNLLMINLK